MNKLRIVAGALALASVMVLVPSCGGNKDEVKLTNVFRQESVKLPDKYAEADSFYMENLYSAGGKIFAQCSEWTNEGGQRQFLLEIGTDGSVLGETDFDLKNSDTSSMNMQAMTFGEDGTIWALINQYDYSDNQYKESYMLRKYTGENYEETPIVSDEPEQGNDDGNDYGSSFYPSYMKITADGDVILSSWDAVKVLENGKLVDVDLGLSESDNFNVNGLFVFGGKIYAQIRTYGEKSETKYYEIDAANGKLGDEFTTSVSIGDMYSVMYGPGYDLYTRNENSVFGYDLKSGTKTEVFNFINSDVDTSAVNNMAVISADEFIATGWDSDSQTDIITRFTRIPDDQVVQKTIITMSTPNLYYDMRRKVIKFNKSSDTYRIVVTDYSQYNTDDDYSAGTTRFNNDLISGKVPDIIVVDAEMNYDSYVAKDLFTDLYKIMDNDSSFNKADYLENIFKAYEMNGKLYSLVPSFYLATFAAKDSLLGGIKNWNVAEFMDFVKNHQGLQIFDNDFNRDSFIQMMLLFSRDSFIDSATGQCSFDSDEFKNLLEFAASLTTENFWDTVNGSDQDSNFWQDYDNRYAEDRVLLATVQFWDLADSYRNLLNSQFKTDDFTFIGFPTDNGNGSSIQANYEYCISERSKNKEGAWEFLKSLINEDAQMPVKNKYGYWNNPTNGLPILKAALDKLAEIAMTKQGESGGIAYATSVVAETTSEETTSEETTSEETTSEETTSEEITSEETTSEEITSEETTSEETTSEEITEEPDIDYNDPWSTPLTQAQVDKIMDVIKNTTQVARYDTKLTDIINEEAAAYFNGQKSLDETAKIIQNRASTYINESR